MTKKAPKTPAVSPTAHAREVLVTARALAEVAINALTEAQRVLMATLPQHLPSKTAAAAVETSRRLEAQIQAALRSIPQ